MVHRRLQPSVFRLMRGRIGEPADRGNDSFGTSSRLIDSAPHLSGMVRALEAIGASQSGELFDRERLGPMQSHIVLGPPWRPEYSEVATPRLPVINLAACAYLGLAANERVRRAAARALDTYGTQAGGARPLSGTTRIHFDLEAKLARHLGATTAMTFSSGYLANISTIVGLFGPGDQIFLDRNAHRSLHDGAFLSGAQVRRFRHSDARHLDLLLKASEPHQRRLVVVDGIYSMEGDVAPLPELLDLARGHGAFLMIDEAHSVGVLGAHGRGVTEHFGIDPTLVHLRTGSLNKAIPAAGGFLAAESAVVLLLRYTSAGGAFSGALAPPSAMAADAALDVLGDEPQRIESLRRNTELFLAALKQKGLDTMGTSTPIVPILVGDRARTLDAASKLLKRGIYLNAIISPGVRRGTERLRCFVSAEHSAADLIYAADALGEVLR